MCFPSPPSPLQVLQIDSLNSELTHVNQLHSGEKAHYASLRQRLQVKEQVKSDLGGLSDTVVSLSLSPSPSPPLPLPLPITLLLTLSLSLSLSPSLFLSLSLSLSLSPSHTSSTGSMI